MGRSVKAFERRFRELFAELGARDREKGLAWVGEKVVRLAASRGVSASHAYTDVAIKMLNRTRVFRQRRQPVGSEQPLRLHCDAGLGGLARWLRAAGCEAIWRQDISDSDLVCETQELGGVLLTTDSLLLERRSILRGEIRALWIPPTLTMLEQLRYVRAELDLPESAEESRCMRCGGELVEVNKEEVRNRIPPRTYKWLNDFYECRNCHQLFWEGTHWRRIQAEVRVIASDS